MTVKELKEKIKDLPDDTEVKIEFEYFSGELVWGGIERDYEDIVETEFLDWSAINQPSELYLKSFNEDT